MKVSEPFSGYQLAKGHIVFHIAFFIGSFFVYEPPVLVADLQAESAPGVSEQVLDEAEASKAAFLGLRWVHFTVVILALISDALAQPRGADLTRNTSHSGLVLFSRALEVLQVVLYQGAIFYDQYIIGTQTLAGDLDAGLPGATGQVKCWLVVEIIAFYMIIVGAITFLLLETCSSIIDEDKIKEPARKDKDIIKYSTKTIEWQGFNYLLIFTPSILLMTERNDPLQTGTPDAISWKPLMYTVVATSVLQFIVLPRIIVLRKRSAQEMAFVNVNDSENVDNVQAPATASYEKRFDHSKWWALIISGLGYGSVGVYALMTTAQEVYFKLWIPVAVFIYIGMIVYYVINYFVDKRLHAAQQAAIEQIEEATRDSLKALIASGNSRVDEPKQAVEVKNPEMKLGGDTYAMAYKAMNIKACEKLELKERDWNGAFHGACFVFAIQLLMITFVFSVICGPKFTVAFPPNVYTLGARFVCTILMHLQVESDTRQGISMLKYAVNHWDSFRNPKIAFSIGFMQLTGGIATEVCCMIYLASITNTIDTVIKFIALGNIAKVDDFYAGALAGDYPLKGKVFMEIANHRRDFSGEGSEQKRTCEQWVFRGIYKFFRMLYTCLMYYFMPFMTLFIPYILS